MKIIDRIIVHFLKGNTCDPRSRRINNILFLSILVGLFVVFRILLIGFAPKGMFLSSELYRGTIAREICEGLHWPLWWYQNQAHSGGSLVIGIILALFFKLLGYHYLWIKVCALLISLATFLLFLRLCWTYHGFEVAIIAGILMVFAPPGLMAHSVILMGEHTESIFLILLLIAICFSCLSSLPRGPINPARWFICGFFFGFGTYFSYTFLAMAVYVLLFIFWCGAFPKSLRHWMSLAAGVCLGLLPWLLYNIDFGFAGLTLHGKAFIEYFSIRNVLPRARGLWFTYLPEAYLLRGGIPVISEYLLSVYFATLTAVAWVILFLRLSKNSQVSGRHDKESFFSAFWLWALFWYMVIFLVSTFKPGGEWDPPMYKFLSAAYPLAVMVIAIAFSPAQEVSRVAKYYKIGAALILLYCLATAVQNLGMWQKQPFMRNLSTRRPYSYGLMGSVAARIMQKKPQALDAVCGMGRTNLLFLCFGLGQDWWIYNGSDAHSFDFLQRMPEDCRAAFFLGLGYKFIVESWNESIFAKLPERYKAYCYESAGIYAGLKGEDFLTRIPPARQKMYFVGLGKGFFARCYFIQEEGRKVPEEPSVPLDVRDSFLEGLAQGPFFWEEVRTK